MDLKKSLASALLCLAILSAGARAGSAQQVQPLEPEWLRQMYAEGWQKVQEGVLQRVAEGQHLETFSYGAEGIQWVVQRYEQQVAHLQSRYDASPAEDLGELIDQLEGQILRLQETIDSAPSADSYDGEALEECTPSYGVDVFAGPQTGVQGVTARASAYFHNDCGILGDTFTMASAQAVSETGETSVNHSHPRNGGAWLDSYSSASANGSGACRSYAAGSVNYPGLSTSYSKETENFSCPPIDSTDDASFTLPNGSAHSFHLDANGHVIDLFLSSAGVWQRQDLTALTGAGPAEPDSALTALVDSLGNGRVFYVGANHHVMQLKLDTANTWTHGDVMIQAGTSNTAASGSDLTSFGAAGGAGVHVLYLDASGHVNVLSRTSAGAGTWSNLDLTALTGAGLAVPGSALTGIVDGLGNGRVFYVGTNLHVMQLKLDTASTWTQGDVMIQAGTSNTAASDSPLISFGAAGSSAVHVLYLDSSQHVNDLARTSAGAGTWSNLDLTALTGAGPAVSGSALTGLVDSIRNGRVFYVGTNQHVMQLKLDPANTWTHGDVMVQAGTSKTVAPGSRLTSFGDSGGAAVHVQYLDSIQHVNDLARTSAGSTGAWSNRDVAALTP